MLKEQILAIRDSGRSNMLDCSRVQRIANELKFYELVIFIEDHNEFYVRFILTGDEQYLSIRDK